MDDLRVDIHRQARVTVVADYTVCEPTKIDLAGTLSGSASSGSWSSTGTGILTLSSITGLDVTATYYPVPGDVNNEVLFTLTTNDPDGTGSTAPCVAESDDLEIHINESAKVNAGVDFEVCEDWIVELDGSYSGTTSSVTWTSTGTGPFSDDNDIASTYVLTAADKSNGTVTFTLTTDDPDGLGIGAPCVAESDEVVVKVNKLPAPQIFNLDLVYAQNSPPETLSGVPATSPTNGQGVFSGIGILAGTDVFDPGNTGGSFGIIDITYTLTDTKLCVGSVTKQTRVNPSTDVDFDVIGSNGVLLSKDVSGSPLVCANQGDVRLLGSPPHDDVLHQNPTQFDWVSIELKDRLRYEPVADDWLLATDGLSTGSYLLTYVYTNDYGVTNSITKTIIILSAPKAVIDVGNNCIDKVVHFEESSYMIDAIPTGTILTWSWLYGEGSNGSSGATKEPTYSYIQPGNHTVSLLVTTDEGCANLATKDIVIGTPPKPDFTWSAFCQGDVTNFTNSSTTTFGDIDKYAWDFDDGDTLGLSTIDKPIPVNKHSGRTTNTWTNPQHSFGNFQVYNVELTVSTDAGCSASESKKVFILQSTTPLAIEAYNINFENGPGTWVPVSGSSNDTLFSWRFGTPDGSMISGARSGANAWWTGGNKNYVEERSTYFENENSYVIGPCLDMSALERPMISLDYWADTQIGFDGAVVQFSVDGGASWQTIGDSEGGGINWYRTRNLSSQPGGQNNFAWSEIDDTWVNARYNLDKIPIANRDKVLIRVAFASNNDNGSGRVHDGFAFDNIYIGEKKRNVLLEHFTNIPTINESKVIDQFYLNQTINPSTLQPIKGESDFFKIQYHVQNPNPLDSINRLNKADPATRALYYSIQQPPYTVMDGILGDYFQTEFTGVLASITTEEIDRRALEDPLFEIAIDTVLSNESLLRANISLKYIDSLKILTTPIILHAALVEGEIGDLKNVVKKLLPEASGTRILGPWTTTRQAEVLALDYTIDVHITNPDKLYLAVFVQDPISRRIHQSMLTQISKKVGPQIVGLPEQTASSIRIYPNPAKSTLRVESVGQAYRWTIQDQRGSTVLQGASQNDLTSPQTIDISQLSNAMYIVTIETKKGVVLTRKKIAVLNGN
jgi:PKD repeat protein